MPDWAPAPGPETGVDISPFRAKLARAMPSLTQLLASHGSLLVLDAASTRVQVGLWRAAASPCWHSSEDEAGTGIFAGAEAVLRAAQMKIGDIGAFVFCEGPGSMLGTRTIAMALRTWQVLKPRPAYAYQSLAVAARLAWTQAPRAFSVIADARRDTWHSQAVGADGAMPPLQRLTATALPDGEWLTPGNFRSWAQPPRPAAVCSYHLAEIFPVLADGDFFRPVPAPDAFQHEAPAYKKWSAQVHSAATRPSAPV
jgi:tRNA threonylcarbamoyladenosine biosynthesis protein TsaB